MALHYNENGFLYIGPEHSEEDVDDFVEEAFRIGLENGEKRHRLADLEQRARDAMQTRTGKRETLEEMFAWVDSLVEEPSREGDEVTSEQKLAGLLEEFRQAREAYLDTTLPFMKYDPKVSNEPVRWVETVRHYRNYLVDYTVDQYAAVEEYRIHLFEGEVLVAVQLAARRYIIARDYGIFDDSWEVVWKLRFGGAV